MSENSKMVVVCNHADAPHVYPTLIMAASGAALGDEVIVFFTPGGAQALVKGELEKIRDMQLKGLPDPVKLFDDILSEGGQGLFRKLAIETKGSQPEALRAGVKIMDAPSFLLEAQGATMTLSF